MGKKLTETGAVRQIKQFAEWGPERAIAAIEETILKGYQGLVEPSRTQSAAVDLFGGIDQFLEGTNEQPG
jgi:hypothetical protein